MTTIINTAISSYITNSNYSAIIDGVAVLALALLMVLLIEKVLIDAYADQPREKNTIAFTIVILPLLFVMMIVIVLRVAQVLHL